MCVLCHANRENPNEALVYDDGKIRAALALHQKSANQGALMVYPVEHCENLFDLPHDLARELISVAQKLAHRLEGFRCRAHQSLRSLPLTRLWAS